MRFYASGFIIYHIILQSQARKIGIKGERLLGTESRYRSSRDYVEDYPNYDVRKESELQVTFQAPRHSAQDYWQYNHGRDNRRTFFEDRPYDQTTSFPTNFFQFMTSLFGGGDVVTPEHHHPYHFERNRVTQPYPIHPYHFRPTQPNYIPPPKPIRASVIKLETITRSPNLYSSFEHERPEKYYPHAGSILKHVLIENVKTQPEFQTILPFKPLPVLPTPARIPATTLKPTYRKSYNHTQQPYNHTDFKYPESVQDQLPHLNKGEVKIPYVSETPLPQIFNTLPTELSTLIDFYPQTTTNTFGSIDIRSLVWSETDRRERPAVRHFENNATNEERRVQKSFPGAVEKVKRPLIKFINKVSTEHRDPVERVTNLTVQGLSEDVTDNANVHIYANRLNMKNLIKYELSKFKMTQDEDRKIQNSTGVVDIDDELSLDAKILKDTNWDGLTIPTTSELPQETTTAPGEIKFKTVTHAFWEIGNNKATAKPETTTEASTTETFLTEETPTPPVDSKLDFQEMKPTTEDTEETPETTTMDKTTPTIIRRRYTRRPKIMNFTPYPTPEEFQKKVTNRNHFAKRQKPNITLTFGNKNILRREGLEVMKFSDEEVKKKRKVGKRRRIYKITKVVKSGRPVENETPENKLG